MIHCFKTSWALHPNLFYEIINSLTNYFHVGQLKVCKMPMPSFFKIFKKAIICENLFEEFTSRTVFLVWKHFFMASTKIPWSSWLTLNEYKSTKSFTRVLPVLNRKIVSSFSAKIYSAGYTLKDTELGSMSIRKISFDEILFGSTVSPAHTSISRVWERGLPKNVQFILSDLNNCA